MFRRTVLAVAADPGYAMLGVWPLNQALLHR